MNLNLETLKEALQEIEEFWEAYIGEEASGVPADSLDLRIKRTAVIKAFEFTYESAVRLIQHQLSEGTLTDEEIRAMNFRDILRIAADAGIVSEPMVWADYREIRNITSHTYSKLKTEKVLSVMYPFLEDIRFLLAELTRRNSL